VESNFIDEYDWTYLVRSNFISSLIGNNNSIPLFIIYLPSQQTEGQLQKEHSVVTREYWKKIIIKHRSKPANKWHER
jgi:hypothetical protein